MKIYNKPELKIRRKELRKRETIEEAILWEYLRKKKLLGIKFYRQFSIQFYITDFYSPKLKLVIEVDGPSHSSDLGTEYDEVRTDLFKSLGIKVLRFKNNEINEDLENVVSSIEKESERILESNKLEK